MWKKRSLNNLISKIPKNTLRNRNRKYLKLPLPSKYVLLVKEKKSKNFLKRLFVFYGKITNNIFLIIYRKLILEKKKKKNDIGDILFMFLVDYFCLYIFYYSKIEILTRKLKLKKKLN
jgi:hypothetical protein